jgi:hypothetical protein
MALDKLSLFYNIITNTNTITITNTNTNTNTKNFPLNLIPFSYTLDTSQEIKFMKLVFKDSCSSMIIQTEQFIAYPLSEQIKILVEVKNALESTKANGYWASRDLTTYKVVS